MHRFCRHIAAETSHVGNPDSGQPVNDCGAAFVQPRNRMSAWMPGQRNTKCWRWIWKCSGDCHHDQFAVGEDFVIVRKHDRRTQFSKSVSIVNPRKDNSTVADGRTGTCQDRYSLVGVKGTSVCSNHDCGGRFLAASLRSLALDRRRDEALGFLASLRRLRVVVAAITEVLLLQPTGSNEY